MKLGPLRFNIRRLLQSCLHSALLLLLGLQASILACLLSYGYVPIPANWGNALMAKYGPPDFILETGSIRLTANAQIELTDLSVRTPMLTQPAFQAQRTVIQLGLVPEQNLRLGVLDVTVTNGTLFLPAVYSPSGHRTALLQQMAFHLTPRSEQIHVDTFAALLDEIRLRGSLEWPLTPAQSPHESSITMQARIDRGYKLIASALKQKSRFNALAQPTLNFKLQMLEDQSVQISTQLSSRSLIHPQLTGKNIRIDAAFQIKEGHLNSSSSIQFKADELSAPGLKTSAQSIYGQIAQEDWSALVNGNWPELELCAAALTVRNYPLVAPKLQIDPKDYPRLQVTGSCAGLEGAAAFAGVVDVAAQSAEIEAQGSVDLLRLIPQQALEKLPTLELGPAPYYSVQLRLKEGFQLDSAQVRAQADQLAVNGIKFDHIQATAQYAQGLFEIQDLHLRRGSQWLQLQFSLDRNSSDYRVALLGSAVPYEYNSILPRWWAAIFKDFDFSAVDYSYGDFIIYGNIKNRVADLYYGYAEARQVAYRGVQLAEADLIVRGRGRYAEVHNLHAKNGSAWARGNIAFASLPDEIHVPVSIRLDFDAHLPLADTQKLFGENIARIISDFESDESPTAHFSAAIFNQAYPHYSRHTYFNLSANSNGPVRFKQVPLDQLEFKLYGRPTATHLRELSFEFADGTGSAEIDINTPVAAEPRLRLNLQLRAANKDKTLAGLAPVIGNTSPSTPSEQAHHSEESALSLRLHLEGPANNPYGYSGYGSLLLQDPKLGSIKLLGPLSTLLENTPLNFTSLSLNTLQGSFQLDQATVQFSPLRIDGPSTQILAPGSFRIDTQELDMRVSISLFANLGAPKSPLKKFSDFIQSPLPNLLQFDLNGTLTKPRWRSLYDPRNLIPQLR
ncbi:MAG: hypothetical protein ACI81V_001327 [Lentimonas sp.]